MSLEVWVWPVELKHQDLELIMNNFNHLGYVENSSNDKKYQVRYLGIISLSFLNKV